MSFAQQVKNNLLGIISSMAAHTADFSVYPESDSSRNRKLNFSSLLYLIISMETGTVRDELLKFFSYDICTASNSTFFQQRDKFADNALPFLFHSFNELYHYALYKNKFLLLAADGSSFSFTRNLSDPDSYFTPDGKTANGYNQIHVVALLDLLSKRYADCVAQPIRKKNEFQALCSLIDGFHASPAASPTFIADRSFHSLNVFAYVVENHSFFLIRATDIKIQNLLSLDLPKNQNCFDITINRILTRSQSKKKWLHPEPADQYRFICREVAFDYIPPQNSEYPITLRVLRFRISESSYKNIITTCPGKNFRLRKSRNFITSDGGLKPPSAN